MQQKSSIMVFFPVFQHVSHDLGPCLLQESTVVLHLCGKGLILGSYRDSFCEKLLEASLFPGKILIGNKLK